MRYEYYLKFKTDEFTKVSLSALRNALNKVCLKSQYINEWISIEETDLKKVEKVIRAIRKGTHYHILGVGDNESLCCYARKVVS